jgi:hypothetical protein
MTTIALAIPTSAGWVPERAESMARLREALYITGNRVAPRDTLDHYREFTDRAPNAVWCEALWTWLHETGADWCLQLQDDVMVAPCFWPALRAMLSALPPEADIVGLTSTHPMTPDVARRGHRWYRTPGNLVGWAYCIRREALGEFLTARAALPETFRKKNEDEQLAEFAMRTQRGVYHPVPSIVDHDTSIPSSYANDKHSHRRPQVTWRTFTEQELTDPTWWKPSGEPEMLPMPPQFECWWCGKGQAVARSGVSGALICRTCIVETVAQLVNR